MCVFQSGADIPPLVRLSLRTLQYLVIPLLSVAILIVGSLHLGECQAQPLLPIWHIVAGSSGLVIPGLYLLFEDVNPRLSRSLPAVSEYLDNVVVFLLPVYVIFEVCWLITGTVFTFGSGPEMSDPSQCNHTMYVFSMVVIVNFWIHVLTPLTFMLGLCCTRIFPYCGYCAYWNLFKTAIDNWTRKTRMGICMGLALPLGLSMVATGALSVYRCHDVDDMQINSTDTTISDATISDNITTVISTNEPLSALDTFFAEQFHIPVWLLISGTSVLFAPVIYLVYDKYCKEEDGGPLVKTFAKYLVVLYLLCGLAWAVTGFVWVFGATEGEVCGQDGFTYAFAFATLIIMNVIMDVWICFKTCVVLYWAFLADD